MHFYLLSLEINSKLKEKLKSDRLRHLILKIDKSDQKFRDLGNELKNNPDFSSFIYEMLKDIGYIDENGQFKF